MTRTDAQVLENVNLHIRQRWEVEDVKSADFAGDSEWLRRVFVDILGRIPTMEESQAFVQDHRRDKKNRLLDRLLASDQYVEEFAHNWTSIWSNVLIGRDDSNRDAKVNREGFEQYLRRAFLTNKPYDKLVFELLTATGANTPGEPDFNGAVNFLLDNLDEDATPATAKTAQIFLGQRVQCTQCHNHPFNDVKQNQFWELNAFFRQARAEVKRRGRQIVSVSLTDVNFAGETGDADEAEIYYEQRNGILKSAYPVFLDGQRINPSGWIGDVNRREELARFVVSSRYMSRAVVNRIWSHFLGYGFTKPIDDMRPDNPVSHPELLESLAGDFVNHGYDLRRLMRWIVLSEPYALSSQAPGSYDDPELGQQPLFSRFYLRQMPAEAVFESLLVATHAEKASEGGFSQRQQRKNRWLRQFAMAYGTDENDEASTFDGTIPQTLMMWNGELVAEATSGKRGTFLHQVAANNTKNSVKIQHLYTAALGRGPTPAEIRLANEVWRRREGDTLAALQDIWWALLNSSEFILNH